MKENLKKEKPEEDVGDESDQSDYSLGDFPDLTGSFVEESHIKEFYEKEMVKIESDPHRIERVKAIKEAVVAYYNIKGQKGEALVAELDCMTYDRQKITDFKRQGIADIEDIGKDALGRNMTTNVKFSQVRNLVDSQIRNQSRKANEDYHLKSLGNKMKQEEEDAKANPQRGFMD